jgi:hypothetical protein
MIEVEDVQFNMERYTLLLDVPENSFDIPDLVSETALTNGLVRKPEFHITIFGFGAGKRIAEVALTNPGAIGELRELINDTDWSFEVLNEYYKVSKAYKIAGVDEVREAIVAMVRIPELENFFTKVRGITGLTLETPPVHISLYTKSTLPERMSEGVGIPSSEDFLKLNPEPIVEMRRGEGSYHTIALPTRPQPDTIIAIFILKRFGGVIFPGVEESGYVALPRIPEGESEETLAKQGVLLLDVGGGVLDHHNKSVKTTASNLVSSYLGVKDNPALKRLLELAERDDFYGKGTLSTDPLDRAFGLSGLISSLNKRYVSEPDKVVDTILPILDAFYTEEEKRAFEMPKELEEKLASGRAVTFNVKQRSKKLKCILIETDNTSMAGFLRSRGGGGYDVVALRLASGHTNILTRPLQRVDLRSLAVLIRVQEGEANGMALGDDPNYLSTPGVLKEVSNWYYDTATNSLLNGGPNPKDVKATSISWDEFQKILELGLSEELWKP